MPPNKKKSSRERRLYFSRLQADVLVYELMSTSSEFHYLVNVLRVQAGQALALFNGTGLVAQAVVTALEKKRLVFEIASIEHFQHLSPPPLELQLLLGISKGDRMDYAIQKSTELGVTCIIPLWTERGEVRLKGDRLAKKLNHWRGVATSACEQAYQNFCPVLAEPVNLEDVILTAQNMGGLGHPLFVCDAKGLPLNAYQATFPAPTSLRFLVGPEGGWSETELEHLKGQGALPLSLGPRILRTETAPVVMLALAQMLWGDFNRAPARR